MSDSPIQAKHPPEEILLGFARALRAAGVAVTADRERSYLEAAAEVGLTDAPGVYWAGRATRCGSPADLERYDLVYAAWFTGQRAVLGQRAKPPPTQAQASLMHGSGEGVPSPPEDVAAQASATEVLRHRDVATLSTGEKAALARLYGRLRPRAARRVSQRHSAARRGDVDPRRTLRETLRRLGEPGRVRYWRRRPRPRRIVLLIDISGSMGSYADSLLRLAHRFVTSGLPVETFTLGTRLTQVTRPLHRRDADRALVAVGERRSASRCDACRRCRIESSGSTRIGGCPATNRCKAAFGLFSRTLTTLSRAIRSRPSKS